MSWNDFFKLWMYVDGPKEGSIVQDLEPQLSKRRVILTGIGGFVGSHVLDYLLKNTEWEIIGIDSFRHKGTLLRVVENVPLKYQNRVRVYTHDLTVPIDQQLENLILNRHIRESTSPNTHYLTENRIDYIFNLASESAVERSSADPVACLRNNYEITINMLEFARRVTPSLFVQFSTDEVYGEAGPGKSHKEWAPIVPSNPYAASKAAQEAMAIAYWRTYNMPIIITNSMNIIGERQDPEKFLPKIIQKVSRGESMPIYGDSVKTIGSRSYVHGYNVGDALVFLAKLKPALYSDFVKSGTTHLARPDRYNICGDQEFNNLELAQTVATVLGKELKWHLVPSETARTGYDRRYALDGTKLTSLGWQPPMTLQESIERIAVWAKEAQHWVA